MAYFLSIRSFPVTDLVVPKCDENTTAAHLLCKYAWPNVYEKEYREVLQKVKAHNALLWHVSEGNFNFFLYHSMLIMYVDMVC